MKKINNKAFTVIELVIVLLVILFLTGLVLTTYNGIQARNRNNIRQKNVQAIQTSLEAYYSQNGHYPSLTDINNAAWRLKNTPNLSVSSIKDPSSKASDNLVQLVAEPKIKVYSYQVTDSNGNDCESDDTNCAKYTITATYEGSVNGNKTYNKQNLD